MWIDITLPMHEGLPPWPGDVPFTHTPTSSITRGEGCNTAQVSFSSHFGTHVDAPYHFIETGARQHELDLAILCGRAYVLDLTHITAHITVEDLAAVPAGCVRLLLRTPNERFAGDTIFHEDFIALTAAAAAHLATRGVRLLGVDGYSIAPFGQSAQPHRAFLCAPNAVAVENLLLRGVAQGWYDLVCLPLRMVGGDGSPARALLRAEGQGGV